MFERFSNPAKAAMKQAYEEARAAGDPVIDEEHLAYALFRDPDGVAPGLCGGAVTLANLRAAFDKARRRGGMSDVEAAALLELGIDVDTVVDTLTAGLDPEALRPPRKTAGGRRFGKLAKQAIVMTVREATEHRDRELTERYLFLGLLRNNALAAGVFEGFGVRYADVRARRA